MIDLFDSSYNVNEKRNESEFSSIIAILFIRRLQMNGMTKRGEKENTWWTGKRDEAQNRERKEYKKDTEADQKEWSGEPPQPPPVRRLDPKKLSGHPTT